MSSNELFLFESELNKHINLETSRRFDIKKLEESQERLKKALTLLAPKKKNQPKKISVIGSNGKGSTSFYLSLFADLKKCLGKVGLYTSPHLSSILERIRIRNCKEGDEIISKEHIKSLGEKQALENLFMLKKELGAISESFTYFEILTLLAFYVFQQEQCGLQIFEAGIGGRWDATKVIEAQIVVLSLIELEHTLILGSDYQSILKEKLGILNQETKFLFCLEQKNVSKNEIEEIARSLSPRIEIFFYKHSSRPFKKENYLHQNAHYAKFILETLDLDASPKELEILPNIPGRLEKSFLNVPFGNHTKQIPCFFDTAHNPPALERVLKDLGTEASLIFFALMRDRELAPCFEIFYKNNIRSILILQGGEWASLDMVAVEIKDKIKELCIETCTVHNNENETLGLPTSISYMTQKEKLREPPKIEKIHLPINQPQKLACIEEIQKKLHSMILEKKHDKILFLGTHRTYTIFESLTSPLA